MMRSIYLAVCVLFLSGCGGGGGNNPSGNANLAALVVNTATLVPVFASNTLSYSATVANTTTSVTITPTTQVDTSSVTVNGNPVGSGSESPAIALTVGDSSVSVLVTAENGAQRTYTIRITRLPPSSSNANLAALALSVTELDQIFDPALLDYTSASGFFGSSTRVTATAEDAGASLTLDGNAISSGVPSAPLGLAVGDTTLTVAVTAQDTVTSQSYSIAAGRGPLSAVVQEAYVKASNPDPDNFGYSIAAFSDTLLVSAPLEDSAATGVDGDQNDNSLTSAGAAYAFAVAGNSWTQTAYLKASNTNADDRFGRSLSLYDTTAAIGAIGEQSLAAGVDGNQGDNSGSSVGAVYTFDRNTSNVWTQTSYVKASNPDSGDQFGGALALGDEVLLVGARFEQSSATGVNGNQGDNSLANAGAAYLFVRPDGGSWQQAAYVKASNTSSGAQFGSAVALSADTLAISAPRENSGATGVDGDQSDTSAVNSGAVYVFTINSNGALSQTAYLKASNTDPGDEFGTALSLDGNLLAIGAPGEDSSASGVGGNQANNALVDSGAVYVFARNSTGNWSQVAYIKASNPGFGEAFGAAVQLRGNQLVVGATGEGSGTAGINGDELDESAPNSGAVYVFEQSLNGSWSQTAYVKASNSNSQDRFGFSVTTARDTVIAAAISEQSNSAGINGNETDNSIDGAGAVYIFR